MTDPLFMKQVSKQTCSADNITIMRGQLIQFSNIRGLIYGNMRDARKARSGAALVNNVLFGLQMIKATCDVIVNVGGELIGGGKVIKTVYGAASPAATLGGKHVAGQAITKAEVASTANAVIGAGVGHRFKGSPIADLGANKKLAADVVINASAMDMEATVVSLAEHQAQLADWARSAATSKNALPVFSIGVDLIKAGFAYRKAIDEWQKNDMDANFDAGIALSERQLATISAKIGEVERALETCGVATRPTFQPASLKLLRKPTGPTIRAGR